MRVEFQICVGCASRHWPICVRSAVDRSSRQQTMPISLVRCLIQCTTSWSGMPGTATGHIRCMPTGCYEIEASMVLVLSDSFWSIFGRLHEQFEQHPLFDYAAIIRDE